MLKVLNLRLTVNKCVRKAMIFENIRPFHFCLVDRIKKIEKTINKEKNLVTIEGKYLEESDFGKEQILPFNNNLKLQLTSENKSSSAEHEDISRPCSFCELEKKDIYVQYTDVLILRQFLTDDGNVLPRKVTGLCFRQHKKLLAITKHAKIAGLILNLQPKLIDGTEADANPRNRFQFLKWNTYFDDYEKLKRTKKYI